MKKKLLITGANGMVAKHLAVLLNNDYEVRFLTRNVSQGNHFFWDLDKGYIDPKALEDLDLVIHLAGASIAGKRWTKKRKDLILSSRVEGAHLILEKLKEHKIILQKFISASGVGYYGAQTSDTIFTEEGPKGNDFLSDVCMKWEDAAYAFKTQRVAKKVVVLRTGVVLAKNEGAIEKIMQPIKFALGSPIGTGHQYMPWIHIDDLCNMYKFVLDNDLINGTFNAVAPDYTNNVQLTKALAHELNKPLFLPNIPAFIMRLLFGEMSAVLLKGSRVSSNKIEEQGFNFKYFSLKQAIKSIV
jgi:hypothetical protein